MKYEWLNEYCLGKKASKMDFKIEWDATRYLIGDKMFVMQGNDKEKRCIITLKCEPSFGQFLRSQYKDIIPGYYMNKQHWNSVYIDGEVPDDVLKEMVDMSYDLVLNSFSKKMQSQILGE